MGHSFRLAKIFQPGLPWTKPSAPGLPAQVAGSSGTFLALNIADNMNEYC